MEILYKTFLLAPEPEVQLGRKEEILGHWSQAKRHPGGEHINPDLMARRDFPYPYSLPGSVAVKAAALQDPQAEARYIERIEEAHLVECLNIADTEVLIGLARDIGLDEGRFRADLLSDPLREAVWKDHREAEEEFIYCTPTVLFPDARRSVGAQPTEVYEEMLRPWL